MTSIDPVCGMRVETQKTAGELEYRGRHYRFCCPSCLRKFEADPGRFLAAPETPSVEPVSTALDYTCPMHPEVHQKGAGACPKCGMALEPVNIAVAETRTQYTCPMHPEIVRDQPGPCPKCGMALEPQSVTSEAANPEFARYDPAFLDGAGAECSDSADDGDRSAARHAPSFR